MSDGIIRICNQHELELRQIGPELVCPGGHSCPVEWRVKEDMPYVDPRSLKPVCPVHGSRLIGSGSTLECQYGHKCTTRRPEPPVPMSAIKTTREASMPKTTKPTSQPGRRGVPQPHGTHQRYFQDVKKGETPCDPCKKAGAQYAKERRAARMGVAAVKPGASPRRSRFKVGKALVRAEREELATKTRRSRPIDAVVVPHSAGSDLESEVIRLRAELSAAEWAYLKHVQALLPGVTMVGGADVQLLEAALMPSSKVLKA